MKQGIVLLLASAVAVIVANIYYAQPLVAMISQALGLRPKRQVSWSHSLKRVRGWSFADCSSRGYRRNSAPSVCPRLHWLWPASWAWPLFTHPLPYFVAAFATGLGTSAVQIIMPYGAHFASAEKRGQVIGTMTSGLMIGIMLSRPVASLLSDWLGWHAVFVAAAISISIIAALLYWLLPPRPPVTQLHYFDLVKSLSRIFWTTPVLRRRAVYQAFLFGSFCLFWTATPLLLLGPDFRMSQTSIALFALAGVSGAVSAPFAGRAADRGHSWLATALAMGLAMSAFLISLVFAPGSLSALFALLTAAILLDAGITANLVLGQRAIFALEPALRSRLNGLYIAIIFIGGASGSALAPGPLQRVAGRSRPGLV